MWPRVVVAGTGSGVGKTTLACAIIRGMMKKGHMVRPFKAGPDYIDPGYLAAAASREAINLDVWLMGEEGVIRGMAENSSGMACVVEGVMGYYDGFDGKSNMASTHHIARITGTPVILCVDAGGGARSVAATILGFLQFAPDPQIRGVILNRVGSHTHVRMCQDALEPLGVRVVGAIPKRHGVFRSRHLGLVPPAEDPHATSEIVREADCILDHIDMDQILEIANGAASLPDFPGRPHLQGEARVGVALDGSFNFYYAESLQRLREAGGSLVFFSTESADPIPHMDGLYMGGGFPEVRASVLNQNGMRAIRRLICEGMPAYAECGGLMYMARRLTDGGLTHKMAGIFDMDTEMTGRLTLNYTKGVSGPSPITGGHTDFHGHEFHYSEAADISGDARFAQRLDIGRGICGGQDGIISHGAMASYGHLYLSEDGARTFVGRCTKQSRR